MRIASLALCLAALGCQSAGMDPLAYEVGQAPTPTPDSPYEIELVDASGTTLPTFNAENRFYVLGQVGQRYSIRVRNPTAARVEAVISVDGLDVIDGETAAVTKRGYIVAPYAEIKVDGFRVSNNHVAAFRFSSVGDSYAGRKGKARNVGVVGVALFAERAQAPMVIPQAEVARRRPARDRRFDFDDEGDDDDSPGEAISSADRAPSVNQGAPAPRRIRRPNRPHRPHIESDIEVRPPVNDPRCCKNNRPGLGTEFGERRNSSVRFTRFVRANPTNPTAYAELRYNDNDGLASLGIVGGRQVPDDELTRRETAEPFPGYAQPPR